MTKPRTAERPCIHLIDSEADTLTRLAIGIDARLPELSALLLRDIAWATIHEAGDIAPDVVTMHATVELRDDETGARRIVQLVYPDEADGSDGHLSILTPGGANLIGRREGQSIPLPDPDGHDRMHGIVRVTQASRRT